MAEWTIDFIRHGSFAEIAPADGLNEGMCKVTRDGKEVLVSKDVTPDAEMPGWCWDPCDVANVRYSEAGKKPELIFRGFLEDFLYMSDLDYSKRFAGHPGLSMARITMSNVRDMFLRSASQPLW